MTESTPKREQTRRDAEQDAATMFGLGRSIYSRHLQMLRLTRISWPLWRTNQALAFSTTRLPLLARLQEKWSASGVLPPAWMPLSHEWYGGHVAAPVTRVSSTPSRASADATRVDFNSPPADVPPSSRPILSASSQRLPQSGSDTHSATSGSASGDSQASSTLPPITTEATWGPPIFSASARRRIATKGPASAIGSTNTLVPTFDESRTHHAVRNTPQSDDTDRLQRSPGQEIVSSIFKTVGTSSQDAALDRSQQDHSSIKRAADKASITQTHQPLRQKALPVVSTQIAASSSPNTKENPVAAHRVDRSLPTSNDGRDSGPVTPRCQHTQENTATASINSSHPEKEPQTSPVFAISESQDKGSVDAGSPSAQQASVSDRAHQVLTNYKDAFPRGSERQQAQASVVNSSSASSSDLIGAEQVMHSKQVDITSSIDGKLAHILTVGNLPIQTRRLLSGKGPIGARQGDCGLSVASHGVVTSPDQKTHANVTPNGAVISAGTTTTVASASPADGSQPALPALSCECEMTEEPVSLVHRRSELAETSLTPTEKNTAHNQEKRVAETEIATVKRQKRHFAVSSSSQTPISNLYRQAGALFGSQRSRMSQPDNSAPTTILAAQQVPPGQQVADDAMSGSFNQGSPMRLVRLVPIPGKERLTEIHLASPFPALSPSHVTVRDGLPARPLRSDTLSSNAVPSLRSPASSALLADRAHLRRMSTTVPAPTDTVEAVVPLAPASAVREQGSSQTVDVTQLADRIYHMLVDRLSGERSRRGL